jgi:hypothetical protein
VEHLDSDPVNVGQAVVVGEAVGEADPAVVTRGGREEAGAQRVGTPSLLQLLNIMSTQLYILKYLAPFEIIIAVS